MFEQPGRGGCWATGYLQSEDLVEKTIETMRRIAEHNFPPLQDVVIFSSTAGGTGSGAGSRILEGVRDVFSAVTVTNVAVTPRSFGESSLQAYNTLLSISTMQHESNGVLLFPNDDLHTRFETISAGNESVALAIADLCLPGAGGSFSALSDQHGFVFADQCRKFAATARVEWNGRSTENQVRQLKWMKEMDYRLTACQLVATGWSDGVRVLDKERTFGKVADYQGEFGFDVM